MAIPWLDCSKISLNRFSNSSTSSRSVLSRLIFSSTEFNNSFISWVNKPISSYWWDCVGIIRSSLPIRRPCKRLASRFISVINCVFNKKIISVIKTNVWTEINITWLIAAFLASDLIKATFGTRFNLPTISPLEKGDSKSNFIVWAPSGTVPRKASDSCVDFNSTALTKSLPAIPSTTSLASVRSSK